MDEPELFDRQADDEYWLAQDLKPEVYEARLKSTVRNTFPSGILQGSKRWV